MTGYSGIGKSSLVNEIQKTVDGKNGYFVSGKFDQFKRTIPYSAINHALRDLMRQILTESESRIATWKNSLLKALGPNAKIVVDAIPELAHIIGTQPEVVQTGSTQNQYNYVMQNFVGVFTKTEHPLVIFLDDLQWADAASLTLIKLLMKDLETPCLLLIGAYRDNEIAVVDPLMMTIDEIKKSAIVNTLNVKALSKACIAELIADTVKAPLEEAAPLASHIYRKTLGNPFFVLQFIKSIHNEQLLTFKNGGWYWDIGHIEALGIADNVVDLLTKELGRLSRPAHSLLTLAACIGNQFDAKTLSTVCGRPEEAVKNILQEVVHLGLVRMSTVRDAITVGPSSSYFFLHDGVQKAAYEGMTETERKLVHLRIGRLFLNDLSKEQREERIFDIVQQLNEGRCLLTEVDQKFELAELNLVAAKKARKSAAFGIHREFSDIAKELGWTDSWDLKKDFMYDLYMELINASFSRADYREMEGLCQRICEKSGAVGEVISAKEMLIKSYGAQYKPSDILRTGIELITLVGIQVPRRVGPSDILIARIRLKIALGQRDPLELAHLPPATDPQYLLQLRATAIFLAYGFTYLPRSSVVLWVALEMVRKSIQYGISPACTYAYLVWGRTLAGQLGKQVDGYKFGQVSATIAQLGQSYLGSVGIFNGLMRHHQEHLGASLQPLLDTYTKALETGDRAGAVVALQFSDAIRFQSGGKVSEALLHIRKNLSVYRKMDYAAVVGVMIPWAILFSKLVGEPVDDVSQGLDADRFAAERKKVDDAWGVFYIRSTQCIGEYYFGEYAKAFAHAQEAISLPGFYFGTPASGFLMFIYSLSTLGLAVEGGFLAKMAIAKTAKMQRRFSAWAQRAPMNYLHKWQLVEAERWRVLGQPVKAAEYYDLAISGAKKFGFINDEALGNELAARFYLMRGKAMFSRVYAEQACAKYKEWGAFSKVTQLEEMYAELFAREKSRLTSLESEAHEHSLDLDTIIQASLTLSGEIQLDKLLKKLMLLLVENAGAQKGILLLLKDGALMVQARVESDVIEVRQGLSAVESADLSLGIVNYVKRTRENVILGDATMSAQFKSDPYIEFSKPKSVMCIALQKQSELVGILYLENNLASDAFTYEHTELLHILSTQIAISLENASLYESLINLSRNLESQVLERTRDLSIAKDAAEEANQAKSEFLAIMSHEIRTPMNGVLGMMQLALARATDSKQQEYLETAQYSAEALLTILNDILDFSKIETGKIEFEAINFDLIKTVESVVSLMSSRAAEKHVWLKFDCFPDLPRFVVGDVGRLRQVLLNLVSNALKFTEMGGINIQIELISMREATPVFRFSVVDTGIGIAADVKSSLFQSFTQADSSISRRFGGTGLGLSICKKLIEMQGGRIGVESTLGVGSRFWFELALPSTSAEFLDSHTNDIYPGGSELPSLNILLAEDNVVNQTVAIALLKMDGHTVEVAKNGLEVLTVMQTNTFDVVLMDMHMPDMDGLEAARAIRNMPDRASKIPIVALTAAGTHLDIQICLEAGMDFFLTKPIRMERVRSVFQEIMSKNK